MEKKTKKPASLIFQCEGFVLFCFNLLEAISETKLVINSPEPPGSSVWKHFF